MARATNAMKWRERLDAHGFHTVFIEYESKCLDTGQRSKGLSQNVLKKTIIGQQSV